MLVRYKIQMMSRDLVRSLGVGEFLDWGFVTAKGGRVVVLWENRKLELVEEGWRFYNFMLLKKL